MLNVVHIIFGMRIGGAENMLADLVNEQVTSAEVSIIIVNNQYEKALLERISSKVHLVYLRREAGSWNPLTLIKIWRILFKLKADVIHCHQHNLINMLPFWKNKAVLTVHDVGVKTSNLKKYRKVFAISVAVQQDLLQREGIYSTVIHNGIQTTKIKCKDLSTSELSTVYKIVQISRLIHEKKGQHLAIEAINTLHKKGYSNIHLYFVGSGPSLKYLEKLTSAYKLEGSIFFLGQKNRNWIYENLSQFDLLLQPSLYEGFGLTIIEGLAAGIPVIASNIDGPAEILKGMPAGFLFDAFKKDDLAFTIERVRNLANESKMKEMCMNSYDLVCQNFSISKTASSYMQSYDVCEPDLVASSI